MEKKIMGSENEIEDRKISARCHCPGCGKRYVMDVKIKDPPKKKDRVLTPCRVCKKDGKTIALIFDRRY